MNIKMLRLFAFVLAFFVLILSTTILVSASEDDDIDDVDKPDTMVVTYEKANPSDGFIYFRKRFGEKLMLFFLSFSAERKERYYSELTNRRLAELKFVIDNGDMYNFEKVTTRYSSTVGMWVDFIINKRFTDRKEPAVAVLTGHIPQVEQLMAKYDPTTAEWRFVKHDVDYLKIYISKLQE